MAEIGTRGIWRQTSLQPMSPTGGDGVGQWASKPEPRHRRCPQSANEEDEVAISRQFQRRLDAARAGDPDACRWLWDTYAGAIRGFLRARGTPEPDEVVNDVFVAVFTSLERFEGGAAEFRSWLYRVARNKRVDAFRSRSRQPQPVDRPTGVEPHGDVEAEAIAALADAELHAVLAGLTADQRDVIILRFVADLSLEQVAAALDKPTGAVKALQHRALTHLRKKFSLNPYPELPVETMP